MEILNSMGGARGLNAPSTLPERPVIKIERGRAPVGERGGVKQRKAKVKDKQQLTSRPQQQQQQQEHVLTQRNDSSFSLPLINQKRTRFVSSDAKSLTSRPTDPRERRLNKNPSLNNLSHRSGSPKSLVTSQRYAKLSRSHNDVSLDEAVTSRSHEAWATGDVTESTVTLPSIITMTSESIVPRAGARGEENGGGGSGKYMDLFQQLVLWKKTQFLLDNLCFTQDLCDALVENDLFDAEMMNEIMVSEDYTTLWHKNTLEDIHDVYLYSVFTASLFHC